ncbi:hypothetical protein P3W45_000485 [Vairimorpha bombi]|jgi:hypothetical protein
MEDLYNTDNQEITKEMSNLKNQNEEDFLQVKLELLQIYQMCYILYKDTGNEEIFNKLVRITNLLRKCTEMEKDIGNIKNIKDVDTSRRLLSDISKKKYKKVKGSNPRKKYKEKSEKLNETCKKTYDGRI